jgi:hypothetical protein
MYQHPDSGVELPDVIGPYRRGEVAPYEGSPGETGVAIAYHAPDAEGTVFIRRLAPDSKKTAAELIEENLTLVKALEQNGTYTNVTVFQSSGTGDRSGWARAAFTAHSKEAFLLSFVYCAVRSGYAFKVRLTARQLKAEEFQAFVKTVQEHLDR